MAEAKLATIRPSSVMALDPQALIAQALTAGAGIETLERLVALAKDVRAEQAREAWYTAMAEFQGTCPPIKKTQSAKIATRSGGGYAYRFAPLDEIMTTILPIMKPLGLSISWRSEAGQDRVRVACRVAHVLGHVEDSGVVEMPVVADGAGANPAQRVGIALTYARRYAVMNIMGISPEDDSDAHGSEGGDDTGASELERKVPACPKCGVVGAIIVGKPEYGGGWLCFAKKGGCGAKFTTDPSVPVAEQPAPFDYEPPADAAATGSLIDRLNALNLKPSERKALLFEAGLGERTDLTRLDAAAISDLDAVLKKRGA